MKKSNIIVIIIALIIFLSSCGGKKVTAAKEKLESGEEVLVCLAVSSVSNPMFFSQAKCLRDNFEALGATFDFAVSNGNDDLMAAQIEKFIEKEADMIICATERPSAVEEVLIKAENDGIPVILANSYSEFAEELSGAFYTEWNEMGKEMIQMADAWANIVWSGEGQIHAAILGDGSEYFNEFSAGVLSQIDTGGQVKITFNRNSLQTPESGAEAAEAALAYDPEIKIFISFQKTVAMGVSEYILNREDLESSQFACFSPENPDVGTEELERSRINESLLRGVVATGIFSDNNSITSDYAVFIIAREILLGQAPQTPFMASGDRKAMSGFGYDYLHVNPNNDIFISLIK